MSLTTFQQTLGDLIADRMFCQAVRDHATTALEGRDLSPRELRQLAAMAGARGMAASGKLYRLNRLTPLQRCLPRTLEALGPRLPEFIDAFWRAYPETRLQFQEEATRFALFIEMQIAAGATVPPLVADALAFETAICRLVFRNADDAPRLADNDGAVRLHPLVAVVRFQMKPAAVFSGNADGEAPGEHYVVVDARGTELTVTVVPVAVGRVLTMAQAGLEVTDDAASHAARTAGWMLELDAGVSAGEATGRMR